MTKDENGDPVYIDIELINFEKMPKSKKSKFKAGDRVLITEGLHKGKMGTISGGPYSVDGLN